MCNGLGRIWSPVILKCSLIVAVIPPMPRLFGFVVCMKCLMCLLLGTWTWGASLSMVVGVLGGCEAHLSGWIVLIDWVVWRVLCCDLGVCVSGFG